MKVNPLYRISLKICYFVSNDMFFNFRINLSLNFEYNIFTINSLFLIQKTNICLNNFYNINSIENDRSDFKSHENGSICSVHK